MVLREKSSGLSPLLGGLLLAWAVVLGGCAPDLNETLMKRVGQEVEWRDLQRDWARHDSRPVVLEGRIAWLKAVDGLVVVAGTRLTLTESQNGPVLFTGPTGHVIVTYRGPLDPAVYCLGRFVTVVGVIRERPVPPGQDAPESHRNPVIEAKRIDLGSPSPGQIRSFHSSRNPFPPFYHHNFDPLRDPFRRPFCD